MKKDNDKISGWSIIIIILVIGALIIYANRERIINYGISKAQETSKELTSCTVDCSTSISSGGEITQEVINECISQCIGGTT